MTSIVVKFRPSVIRGNEGTLFYQIIRKRMVKQYYTSFHIMREEWNEETASVILSENIDSERAAFLRKVSHELHSGLSKFNAIAHALEQRGKDYTAEELVVAFTNQAAVGGVVSFARKLIGNMRKYGKMTTAKRYEISLNSFLRFTNNDDVAWEAFDSTLMMGYEEFLLRRGLCRNTTSFYMRNLRSVITKAVDCGHEVPRNPFKHVYMGVDKTKKRALSLEALCRLRKLDLSGSPRLDYARNIFMFALYTRGMSFVDIAYLKKSDEHDGVITYRRKKTRQLIQVKIATQTRRIMERLGKSGSSYLLPIITDDNADAEIQYHNAYHRVNRNLQKIGKMLDLETKLTLYVARHAWASIAQQIEVPLSTISKAMGHDSEATTQIYLSALDSSMVDNANERIINLVDDITDRI